MNPNEEVKSLKEEIKALKKELKEQLTHEVDKNGHLIVRGVINGTQDNNSLIIKEWQDNRKATIEGTQDNESLIIKEWQDNRGLTVEGKMIFDSRTQFKGGIWKMDYKGDQT